MKKVIVLGCLLSMTSGCVLQEEVHVDKPEQVSYYQSEAMAALNLPFSDAVRVGNMLYLSGNIGNVPGELRLVEGGLEAEARQTMENIKAVLEANGTSFDHAVKLTIMMDDISQWSRFNEIYKKYFPNNKPARSAFGADGLALGAALEVECIAYIPETNKHN